MLRLGVYLDDLSSGQRGQLTVVPGSHHVAFHRAGAENAGRQPGAMPVNVTAGSAVLFHNALWHSTAPNTMPTPRTALYFAYTPLWHRTLDYAAPPAELLRDVEAFPKGRRELLRQLVGATPEGAGPQSHFFPTVEQFPGLGLVEPEHPASGA
jgi:ectoine hydroxylase-related dioxygenase (phytanoyl-CoA dioxygenase family)